MKTSAVVAGIAILEKYRTKPDGYTIGAENDAIYAYATDLPVSEEDHHTLSVLGWFQEEADNPDGIDPAPFSLYSVEYSWVAYV